VRPLVVVPTYEEAENVEPLLQQLRAAVPDAAVLIVDDNSPDGTAERAEKVAADLGRVEVLRRPLKDGLGNAYRAGFAHGLQQGYDVFVQMDADLSHDPAAVPLLLARIEAGADVVIGSRYIPGGSIPHWPLGRRLLSRWGNQYATWMLRLSVHDATSGFPAYRAPVLHEIGFLTTRANGYALQMEVARRLGEHDGPVEELPITFTDRVRGRSKMSPRIMAESMGLVTLWGIGDRLRRLRR
jgi:dolichol-phosphate mannosyltransferase